MYNQFVPYNLTISFRSTRAKNDITQPLSPHDTHVRIYHFCKFIYGIFFHLHSIVSHRRNISRDYFSDTCPDPPVSLPPRRFLLSNEPTKTNAAHRTKTVIPKIAPVCRESKVQERR